MKKENQNYLDSRTEEERKNQPSSITTTSEKKDFIEKKMAEFEKLWQLGFRRTEPNFLRDSKSFLRSALQEQKSDFLKRLPDVEKFLTPSKKALLEAVVKDLEEIHIELHNGRDIYQALSTFQSSLKKNFNKFPLKK